MFFVYNLLLISLAIVLSPLVAVAFAVQPKFRAGFFKKMGFYPEVERIKGRSIWIHAVSVGEINAVEGLVKRIKAEFGRKDFLIEKLAKCVNNPNNPKGVVNLNPVSEFLVNQSAQNGINIKGYKHNIDTYSIKHILKNHGDSSSEENRGQEPITSDDLKKIPEIINSPDFLAYGAKNKQGRDIIIYGKNISGGSIIYIEEVRTRRKTLTTNTMRKYKTDVNSNTFESRITKGLRNNVGSNIGINIINCNDANFNLEKPFQGTKTLARVEENNSKDIKEAAKRASSEGGQVLITERINSQGAADLSALKADSNTNITDNDANFNPPYPIVVTTVTRTGQEVARKKLAGIADVISYFPYDFSFAAKAAIKAFNPALVIIAETEIWPRFVYEVNRKNIPLMLVNGRISPSSFKGYRKTRLFFRNVLDKFSLILMQTDSDADRITKIGAPENIVQVMGNLKFDISTKLDSSAVEELRNTLKVGNNRVLIAGSTHSGEDEIVLEAFGKLKTDFPDLKLLLAPRHPERNEVVFRLIKASGFSNARKSEGGCFDNADIILLDTMGELGKLYAISHLAFIGGGFSGTGGHNPLESAIYGVPVLSGPAVFNFKDIYKFMTASGAAKIANSADELYMQLKEYLLNDDKYKMASEACLEIFAKNSGATYYAIQRIKEYV